MKKNNKGQFKKGHTPWHKGKTGVYSIQVRQKMSNNMKGRTPWNKGLLGYHSGKQHWNWQGGRTPENKRIRLSLRYQIWKRKIIERDNYTCQMCGVRNIHLVADHIQPFAYYPTLRFRLNNGRALCKDCHYKTDTYGGKALLFQYKPSKDGRAYVPEEPRQESFI